MNKLKIATIISATLLSLSATAQDKIDTLLDMEDEDMAMGHHNKEMKERISAGFGALDNDNDGYIGKYEANDDNIWEHFSEIDRLGDNDGKISRQEFSTYIDIYGMKVIDDRDIEGSAEDAFIAKLDKITSSFDDIDNDNSGSVSIEEAEGHDFAMHFGYMDENEDKIVSYDEYIDYLAMPGYVTEK